MSGAPFYQTRSGREFYESTIPELVIQLRRLNDTFERYVELFERQAKPNGESDDRA